MDPRNRLGPGPHGGLQGCPACKAGLRGCTPLRLHGRGAWLVKRAPTTGLTDCLPGWRSSYADGPTAHRVWVFVGKFSRVTAGSLPISPSALALLMQSPAYHNFSRLLLKVPEHTW